VPITTSPPSICETQLGITAASNANQSRPHLLYPTGAGATTLKKTKEKKWEDERKKKKKLKRRKE
jgi:hypothetical protein